MVDFSCTGLYFEINFSRNFFYEFSLDRTLENVRSQKNIERTFNQPTHTLLFHRELHPMHTFPYLLSIIHFSNYVSLNYRFFSLYGFWIRKKCSVQKFDVRVFLFSVRRFDVRSGERSMFGREKRLFLIFRRECL